MAPRSWSRALDRSIARDTVRFDRVDTAVLSSSRLLSDTGAATVVSHGRRQSKDSLRTRLRSNCTVNPSSKSRFGEPPVPTPGQQITRIAACIRRCLRHDGDGHSRLRPLLLRRRHRGGCGHTIVRGVHDDRQAVLGADHDDFRVRDFASSSVASIPAPGVSGIDALTSDDFLKASDPLRFDAFRSASSSSRW